MSLLTLDIHAVRNIQHQSVCLAPTLNFFYGANASGKSALIEAIYILGRAKSFRSASIKPVINFQHDHLVVTALIAQSFGLTNHLGIQLDGKTIEIHINQQASQNKSDLAYALPLQLIHPKSYELLDTGPHLRREFLDWGVFHSDEKFLTIWRRFKKALTQRNSLLKTKQLSQIGVWDKELVYYGTIVDSHRRQYLEKFTPVFTEIASNFVAVEGLELFPISGWDLSRNFHQVLQDELEKDVRYGFTHSGPHRGDFQLLVNQRLAKDFVSRGQLKLLVMSLKLAQVQLLLNQNNHFGCILFDDFAAELDVINRAKVLRYLADCGSQVVITATDTDHFGDLSCLDNYKMFHVEHGYIKPV
ncbi:MAG: DNA replication/repair protein RecF [Methylococcaceae bacterium]|nr:DNA replication/repair protein RecF [Methylococcaceae bacterium]